MCGVEGRGCEFRFPTNKGSSMADYLSRNDVVVWDIILQRQVEDWEIDEFFGSSLACCMTGVD